MSSRKILPSPPGSTMSLAPESRRSVSPIDQAAYHDTEQLNPTVYTTPTTSHTSTRSNEKAHHSTSDQTVFLKEPCVRPSPQWKDSSYWWPWEWLCELLAIGSLGAMIIVLMWYRDKPQSEWRQSYFTLNGLIAFLATLTKTGLIIPVSAAIGQRKWLRFMPNKRGQRSARKLGDFEMFDEASRGSLGSTKLMFSLNFWYGWMMCRSSSITDFVFQGCCMLGSIHHYSIRILQCNHSECAGYLCQYEGRPIA